MARVPDFRLSGEFGSQGPVDLERKTASLPLSRTELCIYAAATEVDERDTQMAVLIEH